ncbi:MULTISPECIES: PfkB family carbohydrate kinase [Ensifer]|uniref:PfkB family carbohydrate kinase n=1 Tax=Ensifer TaxID=106591 RepID=UPI0007161DF8|nr:MULTISPECIES: PfkB family carbohydrate kinase [Ensifer]KQZ42709.1 carbohydrate kinase [Ensifer sp. Root558]MBD9560231.1 fructoselysine 6-kinase [Ensifer sp. ENS03]RAS06114.1 fructoselysine 6-kinase [Ensifer adhaerens]
MTKANPNLIAVGDNCLDAYLSKGFVTVGGNALNVAVQWRQQGLNARYFGALGPDAEGDIMLAAIAEAGLDRNDVEIRPGASAVTLLTDDAGERRFLLESLGVGEDYVPNADRYEALRQADWLHLGTNSSERLIRRLVADGIPFSIDISTRHFDLSLDGVPLVFASGPDDPTKPVEPLIARFRAAGALQVVVTCGRRGSFYHDGSTVFAAGSVPVTVVDTCGAGDSFIATFIMSRFFADLSGQAALDSAAERASETCTHLGGFPQPIRPIPEWLLKKYDDVIGSTERAGT